MRSAARHADAAYLSSRGMTAELVKSMVGGEHDVSREMHVEKAVERYNRLVVEETHKVRGVDSWVDMRTLSSHLDDRAVEALMASATAFNKARLQSVAVSHSGDWLLTMPNENLGQTFTPDQWRVLARWRLGGAVFEFPGNCPNCNKPMPTNGNHAVECSTGGDPTRRHDRICVVVADAARQAGLHPVREKRYIIQGNGEKPADVYIDAFDGGRSLAIDVSVTSPVQASLVAGAAETQLFAAQRRVDSKHTKYDSNLPRATDLVVAAVETFGGWHPEGRTIFKRLAEMIAGHHNTRWQLELKLLYQRLAMALMRSNANSFLSRRSVV